MPGVSAENFFIQCKYQSDLSQNSMLVFVLRYRAQYYRTISLPSSARASFLRSFSFRLERT